LKIKAKAKTKAKAKAKPDAEEEPEGGFNRPGYYKKVERFFTMNFTNPEIAVRLSGTDTGRMLPTKLTISGGSICKLNLPSHCKARDGPEREKLLQHSPLLCLRWRWLRHQCR
jgi:hypothetical protein